jgi:CBS domain-containing protein
MMRQKPPPAVQGGGGLSRVVGQEGRVVAMSTTVRDVMTRRVVAVRMNATFKEMATILRSSRVSAFPVIDAAQRVVGVVSEADLLVKQAEHRAGWFGTLRHYGQRKKAAGLTAGELMTSPALTIGPDAPVAEAAKVMYARRVKRLPVVNSSGQLTGIVSRADVLSVYSRRDDEISHEVSDRVILGSFLMDPARVQVTVRDGIVTLTGQPETDQLGHEIVAAVRHVAGVIAVRDRMTYLGDDRHLAQTIPGPRRPASMRGLGAGPGTPG